MWIPADVLCQGERYVRLKSPQYLVDRAFKLRTELDGEQNPLRRTILRRELRKCLIITK